MYFLRNSKLDGLLGEVFVLGNKINEYDHNPASREEIKSGVSVLVAKIYDTLGGNEKVHDRFPEFDEFLVATLKHVKSRS